MWLLLSTFLQQTMRASRIARTDQKHDSLNLLKKTHKLVFGRTKVSPCPATVHIPPTNYEGFENR